MKPAAWTKVYWPAAVAASVADFVVGTFDHYTGWALLIGVVLLGMPEAWFVVRRQWASTLSDWTWRVLDVTRTQPVSQWTVQHFLALGCYLAIAVRAVDYLSGLGYWQGAAGAVPAAWLTWHLFGRWWHK